MPKKREKELIVATHFRWLVGKRGGTYQADGRSNRPDLGRPSLGTGDRARALERLARLDLLKAVEHGLADRALLEAAPADLLSLEEGQRLYLEHVRRPPVLGGATASTAKRYEAVLQKFVPFARRQGVQPWQAVTKKLVQAYGAWLDDEGYAYASEYLELVTLKQMLNWLAGEKLIPAASLFELPLE